MDRIAKALSAHDTAYQEVAQILFGDGADELIAKMAPTQSDLSSSAQNSDRKKRALTAGLSGIGAAAGAAGLGYAAHKTGGAYRAARMGGKVGRRAATRRAVKNEKFGTALVPLEVAGLGGELMATKILHGDVKKPKKAKVKKSDIQELAPSKKNLVRMGARKGTPQLKKLAENTQRRVNRTGDQKVNGVSKDLKSEEADILWEGEISKMDTDKRQVFGWASVVEVNGEPVHDLQGDIISADEIEKAAYTYVQKSRKGGDNHRRNGDEPHHASDMIESMMFTPEKIEKMGLAPGSVPTGWWVGYQVHDDDLWQEVKKGKRTNFSIHGRGKRRDG